MQDADIFLKTETGRDEIKSRSRGLSMATRAILLMVDGQRNVAALRAVIAGSKAPDDTLDALLAQGLIEVRPAPAASGPQPAPSISTPRSATMARTTNPFVATDAGMPSSIVQSATHAAAPTPVSDDAATGFPPRTIDDPASAASDIAAAVDQAASASRYEHLYTMMNEIVRDFLPAHRRYFIQLKIERCGTADELMELLDTVEAALAKARGDAFASEVVSRLRNAA